MTYPMADKARVTFLPIFKNHDPMTRKQERGWFATILEMVENILHEEVPNDITVFSVEEHQVANILKWVYIKNGSASRITLVCRFVLWDATCRITIDPDGFLLLRDIYYEYHIPHITDEDGETIFTWPGEIQEDLEEFIEIMPGETCWEQGWEEPQQ